MVDDVENEISNMEGDNGAPKDPNQRRFSGLPTMDDMVLDLKGFSGPLHGHTESVKTVTSLGRGRFASGAHDGTVRIWSDTGFCTVVLEDGKANSKMGRMFRVCDDYITSIVALGEGEIAAGYDDELTASVSQLDLSIRHYLPQVSFGNSTDKERGWAVQ